MVYAKKLILEVLYRHENPISIYQIQKEIAESRGTATIRKWLNRMITAGEVYSPNKGTYVTGSAGTYLYGVVSEK